MNQRISVVLAVYNEEKNLRQCFESVSDLAWEIVIVDGGSTDKTIEIAKEFGVSERAIEGRIYRTKQILKEIFVSEYPSHSKAFIKDDQV